MAEPTGASVYLYYSGVGALVYVGVTERGTRRMHEHADSKPWWPLITGCAIEHYDTRSRALAREKWIIKHHRPIFNIQHNPDAGLSLEEKVVKTGTGVGLRDGILPPIAGLTRRERRRAFEMLTPQQRKIAPCIECGKRPAGRRGTCISCLTSPNLTPR